MGQEQNKFFFSGHVEALSHESDKARRSEN